MRTGWSLMIGLALLACGSPADGEADDLGVASEPLTIVYDNPTPARPVPDLPSPTRLGRAATIATDHAERAFGVRITQHSDPPQPSVVYSVHVVDPHPGERLRIDGEVTLSRCNRTDVAGGSSDSFRSPCNSSSNPSGPQPPYTVNTKLRNDPYEYTPRYRARVELAPGPDVAGYPIGQTGWMRCPQRRHHCALTVGEIALETPPHTTEYWVNLVVFADDDDPPSSMRNARSWDPMEVEHHHGGLTVIRLAPGVADPAWPPAEDSIVASKNRIRIGRPSNARQYRRVVYRVPLGGPTGGIVQARARLGIRLRPASQSRVKPLVTSQLLLTSDPRAVQPGTTAGADGMPGTADDDRALAITMRNGANCYDRSGICIYEDEGALEIPGPPPPGRQWWVVQAAGALRGSAPAGGKDFVRVRPLSGGQLDGLQVRIR